METLLALRHEVWEWTPPEAQAYIRALERSEEHTSELQSPCNLVCRLLLEKKKKKIDKSTRSTGRHTAKSRVTTELDIRLYHSRCTVYKEVCASVGQAIDDCAHGSGATPGF